MKTTTMSFNQFFEMERGNLSLKDIEKSNKQFYIIAGLLVLIAIGLQIEPQSITAFQLSDIETIPAFILSNIEAI